MLVISYCVSGSAELICAERCSSSALTATAVTLTAANRVGRRADGGNGARLTDATNKASKGDLTIAIVNGAIDDDRIRLSQPQTKFS